MTEGCHGAVRMRQGAECLQRLIGKQFDAGLAPTDSTALLDVTSCDWLPRPTCPYMCGVQRLQVQQFPPA